MTLKTKTLEIIYGSIVQKKIMQALCHQLDVCTKGVPRLSKAHVRAESTNTVTATLAFLFVSKGLTFANPDVTVALGVHMRQRSQIF